MKVTRRDLLVWSAGAAAGLWLRPFPGRFWMTLPYGARTGPGFLNRSRGPVEVKQYFLHVVPERMRATRCAWPADGQLALRE